ncbi:MAG: hypothetical protein EBU90_14585 [Proteobacteria bacterium]|nr:hypothetical protein [Pseudomonadota bacterium]
MPIRYDIKSDLNNLYTSGGSLPHIGLGDLLDQVISGEVNGPGSSTANALVRWQSTNGSDLIDTPNATISNTGVLSLTASNVTHLLSGALKFGNTNQSAAVAGAGSVKYDSGSLQLSDGANWVNVNSNVTEWHLTGNAGTNPATDYLGTSDAQDLILKTNNTARITIDKTGPITLSASLTVNGDMTVNGTLTYVNTTDLEVTDKNIIVNKGGSDASAAGAGLTVDRTGTEGSLAFDDTLTSKWKAGLLGSEYQLLSTANSTSDLNEGTNLYFTDQRAIDAVLNNVEISDFSDYYNEGIHVNVIYVNDNIKDIQTALTEVGFNQGYSIYLSPGSYGGSTVTLQDKVNLQIIGPATPTGAHQCELSSGRGLTISGASSTRVRLLNFEIEGLLTIDGTLGRHYFRDMVLTGGLTILNATTNFLVFQNCGFNGPINIPSTFAGTIYFSQCDFGDQVITNSAASAVQVILEGCINLNTAQNFSFGNRTLLGQNFLTNGISRFDTYTLVVDNLNGVLKASSGLVSGSATTSDLPEGTNLYYTTTRVNADAAKKDLSNLTSPTAINQSLLFNADNSYDIGSNSNTSRPRNAYLSGNINVGNITSTYSGYPSDKVSTLLFQPIGSSSAQLTSHAIIASKKTEATPLLADSKGPDLNLSAGSGTGIGVGGSLRFLTQKSVGVAGGTSILNQIERLLITPSGKILTNGALEIKREDVTSSPHSPALDSYYLGVKTSAVNLSPCTINLPSAASSLTSLSDFSGTSPGNNLGVTSGQVTSRTLIVKDESGLISVTNYIRLQPSGGQLIDGQPYFDMIIPYESVNLVSDGSNWYIY